LIIERKLSKEAEYNILSFIKDSLLLIQKRSIGKNIGGI